jgi:hypothetical protein
MCVISIKNSRLRRELVLVMDNLVAKEICDEELSIYDYREKKIISLTGFWPYEQP